MRYNDNSPDEKRLGLTEEEINSPEFDPEEFAPAPDGSRPADNGKKHSSVLFAVMCAFFAVIIAVLGFLAPAENIHKIEAVREQRVLSQFRYCTKAEYVKTVDGCDVYAVFYKEKVAGIGVYHTVKGFSGDIEILLTMGGANEIVDVSVISENESHGLGDKIRDKKFLDQFRGMTVFEEESEIDLISRATASSDAVVGGVRDILETGINTFSVAKDLKAETITSDEIIEDKKNENSDAEETTGDADETTRYGSYFDTFVPPGLDGPGGGHNLDGHGGGANANNGGGNMNVDGEDSTTFFETETKEEDTTDVTTAADTTAKPKPDPEPVTDAPVTEPPVTEPPETDAPDTDEPVTDTPPADDTSAEG